MSDIVKQAEYYVLNGKGSPRKSFDEVNPAYREWELAYLDLPLRCFAEVCLAKLEDQCMAGGEFDSRLAVRAFAAVYTINMIELEMHALSRLRRGRQVYDLDMISSIPFMALGVVVGCDTAFKLAILQVKAYRRGWYLGKADCPIFTFMIRILADYVGEPPFEPPLQLFGEPEKEPILNALYQNWRCNNAADLTHVCLAACDYHTWRAIKGEFESSYYWTHFPIEILLLFKLRQLSGLENPQLDHPIMIGAYQVLPPAVGFEADEWVTRIRDRMMQDGYNEAEIYERCLAID